MRRNLIYGSICLAALSCFAVLAQQGPAAAQQPAAAPAGRLGLRDLSAKCPSPAKRYSAGTAAYSLYRNASGYYDTDFKSPQPFASVIPGNTAVADAVPESDRSNTRSHFEKS